MWGNTTMAPLDVSNMFANVLMGFANGSQAQNPQGGANNGMSQGPKNVSPYEQAFCQDWLFTNFISKGAYSSYQNTAQGQDYWQYLIHGNGAEDPKKRPPLHWVSSVYGNENDFFQNVFGLDPETRRKNAELAQAKREEEYEEHGINDGDGETVTS